MDILQELKQCAPAEDQRGTDIASHASILAEEIDLGMISKGVLVETQFTDKGLYCSVEDLSLNVIIEDDVERVPHMDPNGPPTRNIYQVGHDQAPIFHRRRFKELAKTYTSELIWSANRLFGSGAFDDPTFKSLTSTLTALRSTLLDLVDMSSPQYLNPSLDPAFKQKCLQVRIETQKYYLWVDPSDMHRFKFEVRLKDEDKKDLTLRLTYGPLTDDKRPVLILRINNENKLLDELDHPDFLKEGICFIHHLRALMSLCSLYLAKPSRIMNGYVKRGFIDETYPDLSKQKALLQFMADDADNRQYLESKSK